MQPLSKTGSLTLLAISCLTIMVGCVIVPGLPKIADALGVGNASAWLVSLPALGVVLSGPWVAQLIERLGLHRALCVGLWAYGGLGVVGQFLYGPWWVFADRLLLGTATALVMASGTGLISAFYTGHTRLLMIARQGMAIELGGVVFLAVGGLLAGLGWRWPFLLYLTAWLLWVLVRCHVPHPPALEAHPQDGAAQRAIPQALRLVYVTALCAMTVFFCAMIVLPLHLQTMGLSEAQTGYFLAYVSLVAVGGAALMPQACKVLREYGTLGVAFSCYALAHLLFALGDGALAYGVAGCCLGGGFGLSVPLVNHMTVEQSHPHQRGRNLAYLSMALFSGQFLAAFLDQLLPGETSWVFLSAAGLALVAGIGVVFLHRQRRHGDGQ